MKAFFNFILGIVIGVILWELFHVLCVEGILPEGCLDVYNKIVEILNSIVSWIVNIIKSFKA